MHIFICPIFVHQMLPKDVVEILFFVADAR
jgi:hypothetical protein